MSASTFDEIAACTARERALLSLAAHAGVQYRNTMQPGADKLAAIRAVVEVMRRANLSYALIGGVAVGLQSGVPRATLDVDFAVPTHVSWEQLHALLESFGFQAKGAFAHSRNYRHASGEPVQFAFDEGFDAFIERAEIVHVGDFDLRVVTKEDLIAMKRRAALDPGRRRSKALRDQADIALLEGDVSDENEGW